MKLEVVPFQQLYFPSNEWLWLRDAVEAQSRELDFFLWAVKAPKNKGYWAWHSKGSAVKVDTPSETIPILLLDTVTDEAQAHGLFLKTVSRCTKITDVEWLCAFEVASKRLNLDFESQTLPESWKAALENSGLNTHIGVLGSRIRFQFLTLEERKFIFQKNWELSAFEYFETLSTHVRKALLTFLEKNSISASQTKEVSHLLLILTKKFGDTVALKVLSNDYKSGDDFKTMLLKLSQPELAHLSEERLQKLRSLKVPPRTSVFGDPSFERDGLKITHTPKNMSDLDDFKQWLNETETFKKIRELLEIHQ